MEKNGKKNGCCDDIEFKVKNGNDQLKSFISILFEKKEPQHNRDFYVDEPELKIVVAEKYFADQGPPDLITVPFFILNRVMLI